MEQRRGQQPEKWKKTDENLESYGEENASSVAKRRSNTHRHQKVKFKASKDRTPIKNRGEQMDQKIYRIEAKSRDEDKRTTEVTGEL